MFPQILDNGDLVVSRINWLEHMGMYKCVAENEGGVDTVSPFIYPVSAAEKNKRKGGGGRGVIATKIRFRN